MKTKNPIWSGLMSFKFFGLKRVSFSEFQMFESNLFYQVMVDENYKF